MGYQRFDEGTQCKIKKGSKKYVFAMANLQNHKLQMRNVLSLCRSML